MGRQLTNRIDEELDRIFYESGHEPLLNPNRRQIGVSMTDFDIYLAKLSIEITIIREVIDEMKDLKRIVWVVFVVLMLFWVIIWVFG